MIQTEYIEQRKYLKCPNCGRACKHVVNNIIWCPTCNLVLKKDTNYTPFINTDLRKFELLAPEGYPKPSMIFYQSDLLKVIKILNMARASYLGLHFIRFIKFADKVMNETTDFKRQLPRIFLTQAIERFENENNIKVRRKL